MLKHVPNALTALRLVLAAVFFAMLSYYQYEFKPPHGDRFWLNLAFFIYLIALITDFLDGFLARRWKVEGAFGRIVDPFVDKVLVLGSFILFAGKNFVVPATVMSAAVDPSDIPNNVKTITGVVPWMVLVILARELLVTSIRGATEGAGQSFGAAFSGKLKMVFQSITILVILVYVNYLHVFQLKDIMTPVTWFRDFCIWSTLLITIVSGLMYVGRALRLYREGLARTQ